MATGHLSPEESLELLRFAASAGVNRMVVTHASEAVPDMSIQQQQEAARLGALIEHCCLAVTSCSPRKIPLETIVQQIQAVGVEHAVLSSDFGQPENGPPVSAFAVHVDRLARLAFTPIELRKMLSDNPRFLLGCAIR